MKKIKTLTALLTMLGMLLALAPVSAGAAWDGSSYAAGFARGSGSETDPYVINNELELAYLAKTVNNGDSMSGKYIVLESDLDLGGKNWDPIGNSSAMFFAGNFDGKDHTVAGLKVETSSNYAGLFGLLKNGTVRNLKVEADEINGVKYAGALVGSMNVNADGTSVTLVENCHATAGKIIGVSTGGLVGRASTTGARVSQMQILYCSARSVCTTPVENIGAYTDIKSSFAGGLIGAAGSVTIEYCWVEDSDITVDGDKVTSLGTAGGLVGVQGASSGSADIHNCYVINTKVAIGDKIGTSAANANAGGLIGRAGHTDTASQVFDCFTANCEVKNGLDSAYAGTLIGCARYWICYNNCFVSDGTPIGTDNLLQDYPIQTVAASALTAEGLNKGNSRAVWLDSSFDGHPVIDFACYAENAVELKSWDEEPGAVPEIPTTEAPVTETPVTEATVTEAPVTEAPAVTDAPATAAPATPATDKPADGEEKKSGCGSVLGCGAVLLTSMLGCALLKRREN